MTEFVRLIIEILAYIWPLKVVKLWERGILLIGGKHWKRWPVQDRVHGILQPGIKIAIPFFMEVVETLVVTRPVTTPLIPVTLRDGTHLSCSATLTISVENAAQALTETDNYEQTTLEIATSIIADALLAAAPQRADPEERNRFKGLVKSMEQEISAAISPYGVKLHSLRFSNYAYGAKTYRLLTERASL